MSFHPGFLLETAVAILLAVSIAYSISLERRLKNLRGDEGELRKTIADLGAAADRAERAVVALRETLNASDEELGSLLRMADRRHLELDAQLRAGDDILARISRIVGVSDGKLVA